MRINKKLSFRVVLCALMLVMFGVIVVPIQAATKALWGESKTLGKGTVRTFVMMNDQGHPVSIGITLTSKALKGLPTEAEPPETLLALPIKAQTPPFRYVVINWNPKGHAPKMYEVPHFDVHFYLMPNEEREKITADQQAQFAKAPPAAELPTDYMQAPGGVPKMGAHWVDKTGPEFQGKPFTATFIYGTYDGKVTFYEPMVSMALLERRSDFSAPIKQPAAFATKGFYPIRYRVTYDKKHAEYTIALEGLSLH